MHARAVAGEGTGDAVRYVVALHVLMSRAELDMWESLADRYRLEVDDIVHAVWLVALKHLLKRAGDEIGAYVAEACERELKRRLGLEEV